MVQDQACFKICCYHDYVDLGDNLLSVAFKEKLTWCWPSILEQIPPSPVQRTVKGLDISPGLTRTHCGQPELGPGHTNRRSKLREGTK